VVWFDGFKGSTQADLVRGAGLLPRQAEEVLNRLAGAGRVVNFTVSPGRSVLLHAELLNSLQQTIVHLVRDLHDQSPLLPALDRQAVQSRLDYVGDDQLVHAIVEELIRRGSLTGDLRQLALVGYHALLSGLQRALKDHMVAAYHRARFQLPDPQQFSPQAGGNPNLVHDLLKLCAAEGLLVHIQEDFYLHTAWEAELRRLVTPALQNDRGMTVAEIRDLLGTTRRSAVPLCCYLDRIGVTRRVDDRRFLACPTEVSQS
jgi:selenocysteine-specific elongation factor